jgi:hypothetical protein
MLPHRPEPINAIRASGDIGYDDRCASSSAAPSRFCPPTGPMGAPGWEASNTLPQLDPNSSTSRKQYQFSNISA